MTAATVTLPQVMKVIDLAAGDAPALQRALVQSAQRIIIEQGLTLTPDQLAMAAQAVANDLVVPPAAPVSWSDRPHTEEERQHRLQRYSRGVKGWIRRCAMTDEGQPTRLGRWGPIPSIIGVVVGTLLSCKFEHFAFLGVGGGLGIGYTTLWAAGEIFGFTYSKLLPARLNAIARKQIQADPEALASMQACEASTIPMVLRGDLIAIRLHGEKHWAQLGLAP